MRGLIWNLIASYLLTLWFLLVLYGSLINTFLFKQNSAFIVTIVYRYKLFAFLKHLEEIQTKPICFKYSTEYLFPMCSYAANVFKLVLFQRSTTYTLILWHIFLNIFTNAFRLCVFFKTSIQVLNLPLSPSLHASFSLLSSPLSSLLSHSKRSQSFQNLW